MKVVVLTVDMTANEKVFNVKVALINDKPIPIPIALKVNLSGVSTGAIVKRMLLKKSTPENPMIVTVSGTASAPFVMGAQYTVKAQVFGVFGLRSIGEEAEMVAVAVGYSGGAGGSSGGGGGQGSYGWGGTGGYGEGGAS